jgi:hypothetical protein
MRVTVPVIACEAAVPDTDTAEVVVGRSTGIAEAFESLTKVVISTPSVVK